MQESIKQFPCKQQWEFHKKPLSEEVLTNTQISLLMKSLRFYTHCHSEEKNNKAPALRGL